MSATTAPALVAMKTDDGFRVHAPGESGSTGVVTGSNVDPRCTCADFQADPRRACRHIEAVRPMLRDREPGEDPPDDDPLFAPASDPAREFANANGNSANDRVNANGNGVHPARDPAIGNGVGTLVALAPSAPTMTLKRSVSPDGRIDSLSIEFTAPVPGSASEVQTRALRALALQDEIVDAFLREHAPCDGANDGGGAGSNDNGNGNGQGSSDHGRNGGEPGNDGAVPATLVEISAMQTSVGFSHYLVLNVQGEDKEVRLFGKKNELGQALTDAGAGRFSNRIEKGVRLGVACRAILDRSGRYPRVERLLPASGDGGGNGSNGNGNNGGSRNGYGSRGGYGAGNGRGGYRR